LIPLQLSHFGLLVLYAFLVSAFLSLLWRREARPGFRLFLQLFVGLVGGALVVAWLMVPFPSGPPAPPAP
jgi:Na+/proline symporter